MALTAIDLARLQASQQRHDLENHFDILGLHKMDRLKHYGLHFAKYVGRLARGERETKSEAQTLVDAFLVSLSAANTLNQRLGAHVFDSWTPKVTVPSELIAFADAAGRFADACEKIDHLEDFRALALAANLDILRTLLVMADARHIDFLDEVPRRRKELFARQVYHTQE